MSKCSTIDSTDCVGRYDSSTLPPKAPSPVRRPKNARLNRVFDPSKYSTRFIALKFAYLGQRYNGLEFHSNNKTPLPTVEEELWKALNKARLVFPTPNSLLAPDEPNWEGCEYSKCGRTDKGVSAFGQVVGIRVRSNRPVNRIQRPAFGDDATTDVVTPSDPKGLETAGPPIDLTTSLGGDGKATASSASDSASDEASSFHSIRDEMPYCQILNRLLPPEIRMLAWCPAPPVDFSARFSCKERRYKYFFTQPAFTPTTGSAGLLQDSNTPGLPTGRRREGWLDIHAMREAAHKFIGLHDFRNFCKVDPSKQIDNFERRIFHSDIERMDGRQGPLGYIGNPGFRQYEHSSDETPRRHHPDDDLESQQPSTPTIYTFTLHGSAFLWHQVRHMAAILFLVGQGLESPSLIDHLLDVSKTPNKPHYDMADDAPLVLWDCIFPAEEGVDSRHDALEWVYVGQKESAAGNAIAKGKGGRFGNGGVVDDLWRVWRGRKIDEVLAGSLLDVVVGQTAAATDDDAVPESEEGKQQSRSSSQKVFQGGDAPRFVGNYVPVLRRPRMESVEVINARYAKRKGFEQREDSREQGFKRLEVGDEGRKESGGEEM